MHVDDTDMVLDGNGSRTLGLSVFCLSLGGGRTASKLMASRAHTIRNNNGAVATGVLDVLDTNRNGRLGADNLVHGKMMNDL